MTPGFYDLWPTSPTSCLVAVSLTPRGVVVGDSGRLLPDIDRPTVVVCEYRFGAVKEDKSLTWSGDWTLVAELKADFCEPFCLLVDNNNYYFVTETGHLFAAKQGLAKTTLKLVRPAKECPIRAILYDEQFSAFYACAIDGCSETEATCFQIGGRMTERTANSDLGKTRLEHSPAASILSVVRALKQAQVFDVQHAVTHER
jgi:hypothetical protein